MIEIVLVIVGAILGKITEITFEAYKRRQSDRASPKLARLDDVLQWGWSSETLLKRLIALDRRLIGDVLTEEREGTIPQWSPVFRDHPESWILLTTGPKQIIGYWHFAALCDNQFHRAKSGELLDSEITSDALEPIDVPGIYNLYFTLLGVLPQFPQGGSKLIDAFFDHLLSLAERGVFFREACANAFTKDGKRICEGFGMAPIASHMDFGVVYLLSLNPWPEKLRHKRWEELCRLYSQNFNLDKESNRLNSFDKV